MRSFYVLPGARELEDAKGTKANRAEGELLP
jgi:hypothetical protein